MIETKKTKLLVVVLALLTFGAFFSQILKGGTESPSTEIDDVYIRTASFRFVPLVDAPGLNGFCSIEGEVLYVSSVGDLCLCSNEQGGLFKWVRVSDHSQECPTDQNF